MHERDPQGPDPFEELRDLIDEPVAPRGVFADELRSRLMRELSASDASREEHLRTMDAVLAPRPPVAFPPERARRIRPLAILELAAVAVLFLGLVAVLGNNWFGKDPNPNPATLPAVAQQGNETPTPELTMIPTMASESMGTPTPDTNSMIPTESPNGSFQPTVVPPGDMANPIWVLPGVEDGNFDFGGMLVEDDVIYRLIATSDFVGIQAIDGRNGVAKWQQAQQWAGDFFAIEDDTLYFGGGDNTLVAVDAETGERRRTMDVPGNPIAMAEDDSRIFVLLDSDMVAALDEETGEQLWVAQGTIPQNPTGGSTSMPAIGKIAVENGVVAAVSTYGVLSGFDTQTGQELWSHEGFDAATVSIATEDDRFIVIDGAGPETAVGFGVGAITESVPAMGTPGESAPASMNTGGAAGGVSISTGGSGPVVGCGTVFGQAGASVAAGGVTSSGSMPSDAPDGTPEAGVATGGMVGTIVRVQGLDPKTGEVIWAQRSTPGMVSGAVQGGETAAVSAGVPAEICTVDVESGSMTSVTTSGSPAASIENGQVAVGSVSSGVFTPARAGEDGPAISIGIGIGAIDGIDQPAIAVSADESGIYLQLADGSLVKVAGGQTSGETGHHEDSDDDDHAEGTTESDDD